MIQKRSQNGVVWVEFLVSASTVLLSLFVLVPMLAKYTDMRHTTENAARYSNWEKTVWHGSVGRFGGSDAQSKTTTELENEAQHRVLADNNSLIYDSQKKTDELGNITINPFHYYNNHASSAYESLLFDKSPNGSGSSYMTLAETSGEFSGAKILNNGLKVLGSLLDGGVPVEKEGYYSDTIKVSSKTPSWLQPFGVFSNDKVKFEVSNSILVDGWGAGGSEDTKLRVRAMKPVSVERGMGIVVNALKAGYSPYYIFAKEPWMIDVEKVDVDQLLEGENPTDPKSHLGVF